MLQCSRSNSILRSKLVFHSLVFFIRLKSNGQIRIVVACCSKQKHICFFHSVSPLHLSDFTFLFCFVLFCFVAPQKLSKQNISISRRRQQKQSNNIFPKTQVFLFKILLFISALCFPPNSVAINIFFMFILPIANLSAKKWLLFWELGEKKNMYFWKCFAHLFANFRYRHRKKIYVHIFTKAKEVFWTCFNTINVVVVVVDNNTFNTRNYYFWLTWYIV